MDRDLKVACLALAVAVGMLSLPTRAQVLPGGGDCVYDPGETCCQCTAKGDDPEDGSLACGEDAKYGGTAYCSAEVCPFEDPPCRNGGVIDE
jgi:hypothetical protein